MVAADHRLLDAGEEGEELVVLLLRDRVVLVVVALGAAQRQAEPDLAERVGAIDVVADDELLGVGAALLVEARVAVEAGGDLLLERRRSGSRSPASCSMVNWSNGMLRVEGVDDPVAPQPHLPGAVVVEAAGVAEAGQVEPELGHLLAVVRRGEHAVHQLLVGVGRRVGEERVDLRERRRQAAQVERQPADQRRLVGLGRRLAGPPAPAGPG